MAEEKLTAQEKRLADYLLAEIAKIVSKAVSPSKGKATS